MIYVETSYRTIHRRKVYALMQYEHDPNYRYITLKTKQQLAKEQKFYGKSVNLITHSYIDPAECPKLFEEEPFHFSSFVTSVLTVSKRIMPHYMDYIKRGYDENRSFNKAMINYDEIYREDFDTEFWKHVYEIVREAGKGIEV